MQLTLPVQLRADETFASFYPTGNEAVVEYLQAISAGESHSSNEGNTAPLTLLRGKSATGKSHLLYAVCHAAEKHNKASAFLDLADYHMLSPHMLEGLETLDVICIDNIHCVAKHREWEVALFDFINKVIEQNTHQQSVQLVLSVDATPVESVFDLPDLVSRLHWGYGFLLHEHDDMAKSQIVKQRAEQRGLHLKQANVDYLLAHGSRNLQHLMASVEQLDNLTLQTKRKVSVAMLKQVLSISS